MKVEQTDLPEVVVLEPVRHGDHRGWFAESWNRRSLAQAGIELDFVQDNLSFSAQPGTLRGLHFQSPPHAQAKLVRCARGRIFDVAVDIRLGSPRYGQWTGVELSADNFRQLLVPEGFAHGFLTLEPDCEVHYKCTSHYAPEADGGIRWDSCGIAWPDLTGFPVLSDKDRAAPVLADFFSPFVWQDASA